MHTKDLQLRVCEGRVDGGQACGCQVVSLPRQKDDEKQQNRRGRHGLDDGCGERGRHAAQHSGTPNPRRPQRAWEGLVLGHTQGGNAGLWAQARLAEGRPRSVVCPTCPASLQDAPGGHYSRQASCASSCRLRLESQRRAKQAGHVCGPETALNSSDNGSCGDGARSCKCALGGNKVASKVPEFSSWGQIVCRLGQIPECWTSATARLPRSDTTASRNLVR